MSLKSSIALRWANQISASVRKESRMALPHQELILQKNLRKASNTFFGKEHRFAQIQNAKDFQEAVPVRNYEAIKPYIQRIERGEEDVLWTGRPLYFAKTSGTTSGIKYIPLTRDSMPNHITTARNALLCYIAEKKSAALVDGNMIFLSGSPVLEHHGGVLTGRLSGIVNHHIPTYLKKNQLPSWNTNCIDDWEEKLKQIVAETRYRRMSLIGGIPPWMQMYFDKLSESTQQSIKQIFPSLSLLVHGGVNFAPYKKKMFDSIGSSIDTLETFPASEGFFAFQFGLEDDGLLLNTHSGIFFEFIPLHTLNTPHPKRYCLAEVQTHMHYALLISNNAGLWAYDIGDVVEFTSIDPYKIKVVGRTQHFLSAFGEHVIAEEVESAMEQVSREFNLNVIEFTVAPCIAHGQEKSYHEWFVELDKGSIALEQIASRLDLLMQEKNIYYRDLLKGNILQPLKITRVQQGGFIRYMKSIGKLGGQNKIPRLSNHRNLVDQLTPFIH